MAKNRASVVVWTFSFAMLLATLVSAGFFLHPSQAAQSQEAVGNPTTNDEVALDLATDSDNDRAVHPNGINPSKEKDLEDENQTVGRVVCMNCDGDPNQDDWAEVVLNLPAETIDHPLYHGLPANTEVWLECIEGADVIGHRVFADSATPLSLPCHWTVGQETWPKTVYVGHCPKTGHVRLRMYVKPATIQSVTVLSDVVRLYVTETKSWTPRGNLIGTYDPLTTAIPVPSLAVLHQRHGWIDGTQVRQGQCTYQSLHDLPNNAGIVVIHGWGGHGADGQHVSEIAVAIDNEVNNFNGPNIRKYITLNHATAYATAAWFADPVNNWQGTLNDNMAIVFFLGCFTASDYPPEPRAGSGAVATAHIATNHTIDRIDVAASGGGYTTAPTVTIVGDGSGATAVASLNAQHGVDRIDVVPPGGSGYTRAAVVFTWGGAGSVAGRSGGRLRFGLATETSNADDFTFVSQLFARVEADLGGAVGKAFREIVPYPYVMFCGPAPKNRADVWANDGYGHREWADVNPGQWTTLNPAVNRLLDVFPQTGVAGGRHAGCIIWNTYMDDQGHPANQALITSGAVLADDNQPNRRWFGNPVGCYGISFDYVSFPGLLTPPRGMTGVATQCLGRLPPAAQGGSQRMMTLYHFRGVGLYPVYGHDAVWP